MHLEGKNLCVVRGNRRLITNVNLELNAGELVGLIGPNGAGKSTLLSVLAGLLAPDDGIVLLNEKPLSKIPPMQRSRALAWVEQSGPIHWPLTVERLISLGRRPHLGAWQQPDVADFQAIARAVAATDCESLLQQDATTLSGGERTRVLLARALATEPDILLADEPVAALDLGHQLQTMDVLKQFSVSQHSCLVVLHDLSLAARYCDRLYLMNEGQIAAFGQPGTVLVSDMLREVYGVEVARGVGEIPWIVPLRRI